MSTMQPALTLKDFLRVASEWYNDDIVDAAEDLTNPVAVHVHELITKDFAPTPDVAAVIAAKIRHEAESLLTLAALIQTAEHKPIGPAEVRMWFERDRAHVAVYLDDEFIIEWWDDEVKDAVTDGFLNPQDWHGSAVAYARGLKLLPEGF